MRLAWFTPWPPDPSGVAGRSAEVVPLLAAHGHGIDVFVGDTCHARPAVRLSADPPAPGIVRILDARDFVWRHLRAPYDLTVHQIGNSEWHEFIWPYAFRWPGLTVFHDTRVFHARGRALLGRGDIEAFRAEFAANHPDVGPDAAEFGVRGLGGPYFYQWPMSRLVALTARLAAAHSRGGVAELQAACPEREIRYIALGEGAPADADEDARFRFRALHRFPASAVVVGVFGGLTAERRIGPVLSAFRSARARNPDARLVLAGALPGRSDIPERIDELGLGNAVRLLGVLENRAFDEAIAASDVTVNLRWPTTLETSGPWLRALAAGRPTVVFDLHHFACLPTLDPRTWRPHAPATLEHAAADAMAIGIDVLDEDHSLRLAFARLAVDEPLRRQLGARARAWWEAEHTVDRMVEDYERAIAEAARLPVPDAPLPPHLRPDPVGQARTLVDGFGERAAGILASLARSPALS